MSVGIGRAKLALTPPLQQKDMELRKIFEIPTQMASQMCFI
jgi:hypothetical protein